MGTTRSLMMAVLLFVSSVAWATQEPLGPLSLADAIDLALSRNPEVLIAQDQLEELDGKITEVRSEAFPQFTLQGFGLRVRDPSILNSSSFDSVPKEFRDALVPRAANLFDVGVSVKQLLYNGGKVRNALRLAEESRAERSAALETARQRVAFKVFQAFHDLLLARENETVTRDTHEQRRKHLDEARVRFANGVATEIDVLRSEVNLANTEPELIRAANRVRQARAVLNSLIVVDLQSPTEVIGQLAHEPWSVPGLDQFLGLAREARPELKVAHRQLEGARVLMRLARSEDKLSIDAEARWGSAFREPSKFFNPDFSRWNLTLNFKLPVYDGGRRSGLVSQALSRVRAAEHNIAQLENSIGLEIKAAYDDLQAAAKGIAAAESSVNQAERVLRMMEANYRYGAATTLDVVDSQTALTVARSTRINATYDYELAKARLRLATGSPILE